jgi:alpha-L-fucosidase 2
LTVSRAAKNNYRPIKHEFEYSCIHVEKRYSVVPERGYCSTYPAAYYRDAMVSAGAGLKMLVYGEPYNETIIFEHEKLYDKRFKNNLNPPDIAHVLPEVRKLLREGRSKDAVLLSVKAAREAGYEERLKWAGDLEIPHSNYHFHPAFVMKLDSEKKDACNYLRTLDFTSSEAVVRWTDNDGEWERKCFVSIPEKLFIQFLKAPEKSEGIDTSIDISVEDIKGTHFWDSFKMPEGLEIEKRFSKDTLLLGCRYNPDIMDGKGYAGAVRSIQNGGTACIENNRLIVKNAKSLLLITRIEYIDRYDSAILDELAGSMLRINTGDKENLEEYYTLLLENNRAVLGEMLQRSGISFDCEKDRLLSTEELLALQHGKQDLCPALLEKLYDLGRYFLITESGELPPSVGQYNINVNLQVCSGNITDLPEAMEVFFAFIEDKLEDFRLNAKNIFGCRGILGDIDPDIDNGLLYHFSSTWPHHYWISCAGWIYNEFWSHYLVTGDLDFLRNRVYPGLREIALFYQDYLSDTDENGNYIFYPGFSPENSPRGSTWSKLTINACMDIMVCREVLENLIMCCRILGINDTNEDKWHEMLEKLPAYLLDEEGALKEWAWPGTPEEYNHRHVSHHYGVWPGNSITWEDTPELAEAVLLSNRKRGQEDDSAHGIIHRIFTAIRLKDRTDVFMNLKQILEHGFINRSLMANHYPYKLYFPDLTGSVPAMLAEMTVYSSPGVLEFLPALPPMLNKGVLKGIRCFNFTKIDKIEWDLASGIISAYIHSLKNQTIEVRYRYGLSGLKADGEPVQTKENSAIIELKEGKTLKLDLYVKK